MGHALYHWRYALNHNVLEWLAMQGHMTPQKIVERDNTRQKKREKIANKIVDGMEATGVMRKLYKEFKENLANARDAKVLFLVVHETAFNILTLSSPHGFPTIADTQILGALTDRGSLVMDSTPFEVWLGLDNVPAGLSWISRRP